MKNMFYKNNESVEPSTTETKKTKKLLTTIVISLIVAILTNRFIFGNCDEIKKLISELIP